LLRFQPTLETDRAGPSQARDLVSEGAEQDSQSVTTPNRPLLDDAHAVKLSGPELNHETFTIIHFLILNREALVWQAQPSDPDDNRTSIGR
jgi:hypothetical protein